jgi:hypothetical protein
MCYKYLLIILHFATNKHVHAIDYQYFLRFSANPIDAIKIDHE